jgi:hypothetical protein
MARRESHIHPAEQISSEEASVKLDSIQGQLLKNGIEPEVRLAVHSMAEAKREMIIAAQRYEKRFGIKFTSLTHFPQELLNQLHRSQPNQDSLQATIASDKDESILIQMNLLSQLANRAKITVDQRKKYYSALLSIYKKLPLLPDEFRRDARILFIGIEREGRILAQSLNWLPRSHSIHPHAKRIPFNGGLLIGLTDLPRLPTAYNGCVIIDGAIASGATIMAIIERLRSVIANFSIYSVHSSAEGIRAISAFAKSGNINAQIIVGHATAGIDNHFYAIDPDDPRKVVVGDLGDTISDIVE